MLEEDVLSCLEQSRGQLITGGEMARRLQVSRTAVWKAVHVLKEKGHAIESVPNCGYRLAEESDGLSREAIQSHLRTQMLGRELECHQSLPSTNTYIKGLDTALLPEGFAVLADGQTQGRGRLGRSFAAPAGEGVYLSVLLKPELELSEAPMLTICAAVAVRRAIQAVWGLWVGIKWVNDLYWEGKKLCGILSEAFVSAELGRMEYAVVGIGVNTGQVAPEVAEIATSLWEATGRSGLRNRLAAEILNQLEEVYHCFGDASGRKEILEEYRNGLCILGRQVKVLQGGEEYLARVSGLDDMGALLVTNSQGEEIALRSGEIKLI